MARFWFSGAASNQPVLFIIKTRLPPSGGEGRGGAGVRAANCSSKSIWTTAGNLSQVSKTDGVWHVANSNLQQLSLHHWLFVYSLIRLDVILKKDRFRGSIIRISCLTRLNGGHRLKEIKRERWQSRCFLCPQGPCGVLVMFTHANIMTQEGTESRPLLVSTHLMGLRFKRASMML